MKKRLTIARKLLKDDGLIFVSIDDNEQAYLKAVMDEVFGEDNFVSNIVWKSTIGAGDSKTISKSHEYILCYSSLEKFNGIENLKNNKKLTDSFFNERGSYEKGKIHHPKRTWLESLDYPIYVLEDLSITLDKPETGPFQTLYAGSDTWTLQEKKEDWKRRNAGLNNTNDWRWTWSKGALLASLKYNCLIVEGDFNNKLSIFKKKYEKWNYNAKKKIGEEIPIEERNKGTLKSIIDLPKTSTQQGGKEIRKIFRSGDKVFDYPKPINLVKILINQCSNKGAVILDFFAGSGTTGHAVLELNREDGGRRRYILITNNEMWDNKRNEEKHLKHDNTYYVDNTKQVNTKVHPQYGIARVITRERIYRIINGEGSDGSHLDLEQTYPSSSLRYILIDWVPNNVLSETNIEDLDKYKPTYEEVFGVSDLKFKTVIAKYDE